MSEARPLPFLVAGDPAQRTGGYGYDRRIVAGLQALGRAVSLEGLPGRFPLIDATAEAALDARLAAEHDGRQVVVDGLALGGAPAVAERHGARLRLVALVHHPLADESGLDAADREALLKAERRALRAVTAVIVTSGFTARRLAALDMSAPSVTVVEPGTDAVPVSVGRDAPPWRLLCVASVIPRKGHGTLVAALDALRDRDWLCRCVGGLTAAPAHVATVRRDIHRSGLGMRIELLGERDGDELNALYSASDLFVLPTRYEGYGMAFAEALARALPVIAGDGGAVRDTVPEAAGERVPPDDPAALAAALARFMDDPAWRRSRRAGAAAARARLPDWAAQARRFDAALRAVAA